MPNKVNNDSDRPKVPIPAEEAYKCCHMRCRTIVISATVNIPMPMAASDLISLKPHETGRQIVMQREMLQGPPMTQLVCVSPQMIEKAGHNRSADVKAQISWLTTRLEFCQVCKCYEKPIDPNE